VKLPVKEHYWANGKELSSSGRNDDIKFKLKQYPQAIQISEPNVCTI
jgi:hypothetical protein